MITIDYTINCSQCGKKICGVSLSYFGVPHNSSPVACCLDCLPKRLDELEKEGYKPEVIKTFRDWLREVEGETDQDKALREIGIKEK